MPRIEFWLLDVAGGEGDNVDLWGITPTGERMIVRVPFTAYFYLVSSRQFEAMPSIQRVEKVSRRRLGRPVECLRMYVQGGDHEKLAERLVKDGVGEAYGYDIRYSDLFLISTGVSPSSWLTAEADEMGSLAGYKVYGSPGPPSPSRDQTRDPGLRVLSFNPVYLPAQASPKPERDPVVAISVYDGSKVETISDGEGYILESFVDRVEALDPDVIAGFQTNKLHWWYLQQRARKLGIKLAIGRGGGEPHGSLYGHVSVRGRANVDVLEFAGEVPEIKLETLEEIAKHLKLRAPEEPVEDFEVRELWGRDRDRVIEYSEWRARTIMEVFDSISDYVFSLSSITGIPPDHVLTAATGFKVENYLMRFAEMVVKELIPPRREVRHIRYPGGMVIQPKPGLHEDVAVLDFKSMYPSLMIKYNISLETITKDGRMLDGELGVLPRALMLLLDERDRARKEEGKYPSGSREQRVLDAKQKALKRIANAVYGYTGWAGARWYAPHVAAAITAKGRETISSVVERAKEMGLDLIYGDTDSVFISYEPDKVDEMLSWIESELGLEVKLEKVYSKVLFTEAKKRYAGITSDGTMDVVGLEAVRGDWSEAAKRAQLEVLETLLRTGRVDEAVSAAKRWIKAARAGELPLKSLIIWKQLVKPLDEYEATAPHVVVARGMIERGWTVKPGDKVGYIVTKGPGKLYMRTKPYFEVKSDQVDWDYYAEKQIAATCIRVLGGLGVSEDRILTAGTTTSLEEFFGP